MGHNWKTLLLVVVGAAIAGWSAVRLLGRGPREQVAIQTVAVVTPAAGLATTASLPTAPPMAASRAVDDPPPAEQADEAAVIERELALLAQALVKDQRIADRVMPRVNDVLDVPGPTQYRRAPDFWEPALASAGEMTP